MPATSLLVTDRPAFEEDWRPALLEAGFTTITVHPDALVASAAEADAAVIDAGSSLFDEDELLATTGLARALVGAVAVALPEGHVFSAIGDVLSDLCPGLIVEQGQSPQPIARALLRRGHGERRKRFEYLTVSPRPDELLAILGDGQTVLLRRPVNGDDDKSEVEGIALSNDARSAELSLQSGHTISLRASDVGARFRGAGGTAGGAAVGTEDGTVDGVKLGARLRALRLSAGLTQAELARRTGIHRPNIARVEAGRHTPSLETLARLAHAIGVPTTRVLTDEVT